LDANISANSIDIVVNNFNTVNDVDGHGTTVAGVIGAEKNDFGMHGVAYGATLLAIRADGLGNCWPEKTCPFFDPDLVLALDYAIAQGAGVINMSIGGPGASSQAFTDALLRAVNAGIIITIAAGNSATANPLYPALYAKDPVYNGQVIAVGATNSLNIITDFSELAGTAQNNFLVAPGENIFTTSNNGGYTVVDGTSFSAPFVAGAAALLKQRFPLLTGKQIVDLMYATATDLGVPGTDAVYGRGLLNISAAMSPLGWITVPLPDGTDPGIVDSRFSLGPAFGDALTTAPALTGVLGLDSWSRAFPLDLRGGVGAATADRSGVLTGFVRGDRTEAFGAQAGATQVSLRLGEPARRQGPGHPATGDRIDRFQSVSMASQLGRLGVGLYFGAPPTVGNGASATLPAGSSRFAAPQLSLLGPGGGVSGSIRLASDFDLFLGLHRTASGPRSLAGTMGQAWISRPGPGGKGRFALGLGAVSEDSSLFRTTSSGVFGEIRGGTSQFLAVWASRPMTEKFQVFGAYTQATAKLETAGGIMSGWRGIRASAFALGLSGRDIWAADDRLTLTLGQPLRVDRARVDLTFPVARNGADGFQNETRTINAVPSGRELDLEVSYGRTFQWGGALTAVFGLAKHPGHNANERVSAFGGARIGVAF